MDVQERRSASRYVVFTTGYAVLNGVDLDLKTHDISSGGVLVEFASHCSIREGLKLGIHLDIGYVGTAVVCRAIATEERTLYALKFENSLPQTVTIH